MATPEDVRVKKKLRSEFNKRMVDITGLDIQVMHGVVYLRGVLKPIKGGPENLRSEVDTIGKLLKSSTHIKDVVVDCAFRS